LEQRQPSHDHKGGKLLKPRQKHRQLQQQQRLKTDEGGRQNEPSQADAAGNEQAKDDGVPEHQHSVSDVARQASSATVHGQATEPENDRTDGSPTANKLARAKIDRLRSSIDTLTAACSNEADEDFQWFSAALQQGRRELEALELAESQQRERGGS
jgi:hypothetical protein